MNKPATTDTRHTEHAAGTAQDLRALLFRLRRRLRDQALSSDLTPSQVAVLRRLESDGPATASALARAEGMRPQSIAPAITALESAGMVSAEPHPTDGRQTLLSLTEVCRNWMLEQRAARQDWLTRMLAAHLSESELDTVSEALKLLARLVED